MIGAVADQLLQGTNAGAHIDDLLHGGTLEKFAIWADCAKGKIYCKDWYDDEMKQFAIDNTSHHAYHYTDIPIEEDHYFPDSVGANQDDIVHIMRQCIDILRGQDTAATNPHGFSPRIALVLLAHFVGDIHQPLHVGAVYLNADESYVNPNQPGGEYTETHGGNFLMITAATNLHSYWDSNAVKRVMTKEGVGSATEYAAAILERDPPDHWETDGDIGEWPKRWADEIMPLAAGAYNPLQLGHRYMAHDRQGDHLAWDIERKPASYVNDVRDTTDMQLAKAGYRLAELLKRIWP
jgi:hypothetical protein